MRNLCWLPAYQRRIGATPATMYLSTGARTFSRTTLPPTLNSLIRGSTLILGSAGIDYLLANESSGYFPLRLVRSHLTRGRLRQPKRTRKFVYPVFMVYPEATTKKLTSRSSKVFGARHPSSTDDLSNSSADREAIKAASTFAKELNPCHGRRRWPRLASLQHDFDRAPVP